MVIDDNANESQSTQYQLSKLHDVCITTVSATQHNSTSDEKCQC